MSATMSSSITEPNWDHLVPQGWLVDAKTHYAFLKSTMDRILFTGRAEKNENLDKVASLLGNATLNKDFGPDHRTVSQLFHQKDMTFDILECRAAEKACKTLWPESVNDAEGIFRAKGIYSLANVLRRKKRDGTPVVDYMSHVESELWKGVIYTYTALFYNDGDTIMGEPEYIKERRVWIAWNIANALPQGTPYGLPRVDPELSEGSAVKTLQDIYKWQVSSIKNCTTMLLEGFRVMDVGFGAKGLSVPDAVTLRERTTDTKATERLTVAVIEQDQFMKTVAWGILPIFNTWKDMVDVLRHKLEGHGVETIEDGDGAVRAGVKRRRQGTSVGGMGQEDAHEHV